MMECRICFENNNQEDMIHPCLCRGTSRDVHKECLKKWIINNPNIEARVKCMECNYKYKIIEENYKFYLPNFNTLKYDTFINYILYILLNILLLIIFSNTIYGYGGENKIIKIYNKKVEKEFKEIFEENEFSKRILCYSFVTFVKFNLYYIMIIGFSILNIKKWKEYLLKMKIYILTFIINFQFIYFPYIFGPDSLLRSYLSYYLVNTFMLILLIIKHNLLINELNGLNIENYEIIDDELEIEREIDMELEREIGTSREIEINREIDTNGGLDLDLEFNLINSNSNINIEFINEV